MLVTWRWDEPTTGGPVEWYKVQITNAPMGNDFWTYLTDALNNQAAIEMPEDQPYYIRVIAVGQWSQEGPPSERSDAWHPVPPPGPPGKPHVVS